MKRIQSMLLIASALLALELRGDDIQPLPYTEGSVWAMSFVKVKPGFTVDYLRSLNATWRKILDEAKKQKLVLSYKVLSADRVGSDDWDLCLMVEYKNMAALDGLVEKMRNIALPSLGGEDKARELQTKRLEVRDIIANKLARELLLK